MMILAPGDVVRLSEHHYLDGVRGKEVGLVIHVDRGYHHSRKNLAYVQWPLRTEQFDLKNNLERGALEFVGQISYRDRWKLFFGIIPREFQPEPFPLAEEEKPEPSTARSDRYSFNVLPYVGLFFAAVAAIVLQAYAIAYVPAHWIVR